MSEYIQGDTADRAEELPKAQRDFLAAQQEAFLALQALTSNDVFDLERWRKAVELVDNLVRLRRVGSFLYGQEGVIPEDPEMPLAELRALIIKRLEPFGGYDSED